MSTPSQHSQLAKTKAALQAHPTIARYWLDHITALLDTNALDEAREIFALGQRKGLRGPAFDALALRLASTGTRAVSGQQQHPGALAEAFNRQGVQYRTEGRLAEAEACYRKAVEVRPDFAVAHYNLANILKQQGRTDLALSSYATALALNPDLADAHYNLGNLYKDLGRPDDAERHLNEAIRCRPDLAIAHYNLANVLRESDRLSEAESCFRSALALQPGMFQAYANLGVTIGNQGLHDRANDCCEAALALGPDVESNHNSRLFVLNYHPDKSPEEIYAAYGAYEAQFGAPLRTQWPAHTNAPLQGTAGPRRLRIGYVSPDFSQHSVRHFLEPLLASHDHSRFEVFAYAELAREDAVTARYRSYCDHFILTRGMSDEALAARIRSDAIDVLVDLAGHTAGNRLLVFARKPAPVSLSWLGYGYTTGLKAIDYLLTDEASAPVGSEHLFSEAPWRLPSTPYVYRPDPDMGEVSSLPAMSSGFVTFGTLTRAIRINHRTVRVWAQILKRVPRSRLMIDSRNFQHASMQDMMAERFTALGIARERLLIGCHSPPWDTLRAIDIGLDCFPHNSGTTLFETLYMGVPYITLAGRPSVGRLGRSILTGLNDPQWLEDWCAATEQEYIDKAVALASDLQALQSIRQQLRSRMQASMLMDEERFARTVEQSYLNIFERQISTPPSAP